MHAISVPAFADITLVGPIKIDVVERKEAVVVAELKYQ